MTSNRWRIGSTRPHTVWRDLGGVGHDERLGVFDDPEDARLAVDAVNAQADCSRCGHAVDDHVDNGDGPICARMVVDHYVRGGADECGCMLPVTPTAPPSCDCPGTDGTEPAGSAVGQRGAPTRDVLVEAFKRAEVVLGPPGAAHFAEPKFGCPSEHEAERMADVALAALRGAGADGGGEEAHVGETHVEGGHTLAHAAAELDDAHARVDVARDNVINGCVRDDLGRALAEIEVGRATLRLHRCPSEEVDDLARLASAAGVDPDAADPVGKIETVIREGRALPQPTSLADDQGVVADSFGLAAWVHDSGDTVYVNRDREVLVRPGRGQYVLSTGWLGQAILAAEQWADAHIEAGDEVTGDRAVTAPVGTKLGARNAAVAAVRTTGGWSVTGMSHEQDHEHAVRINEWVVLALGGRS